MKDLDQLIKEQGREAAEKVLSSAKDVNVQKLQHERDIALPGKLQKEWCDDESELV